MPHCIVRIFEPLPMLLSPAPGRHRGPDQQSVDPCTEASTARLPRASASWVLDGEEIGLVHPHLVAHERREQQHRRAQRRAVRPAVHGIDIGAQLVDGAEARA